MPGGSKLMAPDPASTRRFRGCLGGMGFVPLKNITRYDRLRRQEREISDEGCCLPAQVARLGGQAPTLSRQVKAHTPNDKKVSATFAYKVKGMYERALGNVRKSSPHCIDLFGNNQLLFHVAAAPMKRRK